MPQCDGRYLCDSEELKEKFRTNFIAGLKRLHKNGKLKLKGEWSFLQSKAAFEYWLKPMEQVTWVAYIEPPLLRRAAMINLRAVRDVRLAHSRSIFSQSRAGEP